MNLLWKRVVVIARATLLVLAAVACVPPTEQRPAPPEPPVSPEPAVAKFSRHYPDSLFQITEGKKFSVELIVKGKTLTRGRNAVDLIVHDREDRDVIGAAVAIDPWMSAHGHGLPKAPRVEEGGGGLYRVPNLYLPMRGAWDLVVTVRTAGREDSTVFKVTAEDRRPNE